MTKKERLKRDNAQVEFHKRNRHLQYWQDNEFYDDTTRTFVYYEKSLLTANQLAERVNLQKSLKGKCLTVFYHDIAMFHNKLKVYSTSGLNFDFG